MHLKEGRTARADPFLSARTRRVYYHYARGILTEAEAIHLIGQACLEWTHLARSERVRPGSRDVV